MMGVRHTAGSASRRPLWSPDSSQPAPPACTLLRGQHLGQTVGECMVPDGPPWRLSPQLREQSFNTLNMHSLNVYSLIAVNLQLKYLEQKLR